MLKATNLLSNALVFASRSTLCSVMAQLTEDIQPSFDTTLKSKAVSENCNVKFTCVVSGRSAYISLGHLHALCLLFLGVTETFQIICDVMRRKDFTLEAPKMSCFILPELLYEKTSGCILFKMFFSGCCVFDCRRIRWAHPTAAALPLPQPKTHANASILYFV